MSIVTNRNAIKQALLNLAATATFSAPINGTTTWASPPSRRLRLWGAVDPTLQPALFLTQHREGYETRGVGPLHRRWLDLQLWCYASTQDQSIIGDQLLDLMEEALEIVLQPPPGFDEQTLGGLAFWTRIMRQDNLFIRDPGDIDGQALLVLPVRVLMP